MGALSVSTRSLFGQRHLLQCVRIGIAVQDQYVDNMSRSFDLPVQWQERGLANPIHPLPGVSGEEIIITDTGVHSACALFRPGSYPSRRLRRLLRSWCA